jgi:hypothetical protein
MHKLVVYRPHGTPLALRDESLRGFDTTRGESIITSWVVEVDDHIVTTYSGSKYELVPVEDWAEFQRLSGW